MRRLAGMDRFLLQVNDQSRLALTPETKALVIDAILSTRRDYVPLVFVKERFPPFILVHIWQRIRSLSQNVLSH